MDLIKRWKHPNIMIFIVLTILGVLIHVFYGEESFMWNLFNIIGVSTTVALAVLALKAYFEYAKGEDEIKIFFVPYKTDDNKIPCARINTKVYTQRKFFTRGEVLGLLRMIQITQGHFQLKAFNENTDILEQFTDIQNGEANELCIEITKEELKQFKVVCNE